MRVRSAVRAARQAHDAVERQLRSALRDACARTTAAEIQRLGFPLAVIFASMREATVIELQQRGDAPQRDGRPRATKIAASVRRTAEVVTAAGGAGLGLTIQPMAPMVTRSETVMRQYRSLVVDAAGLHKHDNGEQERSILAWKVLRDLAAGRTVEEVAELHFGVTELKAKAKNLRAKDKANPLCSMIVKNPDGKTSTKRLIKDLADEAEAAAARAPSAAARRVIRYKKHALSRILAGVRHLLPTTVERNQTKAAA